MDTFSNPDAEKSVLGAWLVDNKTAQRATEFEADDFTIPAHRDLFRVLRSLVNNGEPLDMVTIMTRAGEMGFPGVDMTMAECMGFVPSSVNHDHYGRIVKACSQRRRLERLAMDFRESLADPDTVPEDALEKMILEGRKESVHEGVQGLEEIAYSILDKISAIANGETGAIKTGFNTLDHFTGGLFPGEMTIIGARPAVGKSAFALNLVLNILRQGKRVLLFSLEMTEQNWLERALAYTACIDSKGFRTGKIKNEDSAQIASHLKVLCSLPLKISCKANSVEEIASIIRREMSDGGVDVVIVDYLQLLETRQKAVSRYEVVSYVSRTLKKITLEYNIPVVALAQVKRPEGRVVEMPILSDLRDSGSIEQDADNVMFLHRVESKADRGLNIRPEFADMYAGIEESNKKQGNNKKLRYVLLNVAKARNGEIGTTDLIFDGSHMAFTEPHRAY